MRLILLAFILPLVSLGQKVAEVYPQSEPKLLPTIEIFSDDSLNSETKKMARILIDGEEYYCGLEFHGNSTLLAPKKSYDLEFRTEAGEEKSVSVLGFPPEEDFILLANYYDPSNIRNAIIFDMWGRLGHYAPCYQHCRLFLNGMFQGVYLFTEKIKVDDFRVQLNKELEKPLDGPRMLLRYDRQNEDRNLMGAISMLHYSEWESFRGIELLYPKYKAEYSYQYREFSSAISDANQMLAGSKERSIEVPSPLNEQESWDLNDVIDYQSFVDYFLVNELAKNPDAYVSSVYMNYDGTKLAMGPIWDFDLAFANYLNPAFDSPEGWVYKQSRTSSEASRTPSWWHNLMCNSSFRQACYDRLSVLEDWIEEQRFDRYIGLETASLKRSVLQENKVWGVNSAFPPSEIGPVSLSTVEEGLYIHDFLIQRLNWIRAHLLTEPCLPAFEIAQEYKNYPALNMLRIDTMCTTFFDNSYNSMPRGIGTRYSYSISYTYHLYNRFAEEVSTGPMNGSSLSIPCEDLKKGKYYLMIYGSPYTSLAISAALMPEISWFEIQIE